MTNVDGPVKDQVFTDATGRYLRVSEVHLADPLGREIIGVVVSEDGVERDYACTLADWMHIWQNKEPPTDPRKMTHG